MNERVEPRELGQLRARLRLFRRDLEILDTLTAQNTSDETHAGGEGKFRYFMDTNAVTFFGNPIEYVDGVTLFPPTRGVADYEPKARKITSDALPLLATETAQFLFFGNLSSQTAPARFLAPAHAIEVLRFIANLEEQADEEIGRGRVTRRLANRVRETAAAAHTAASAAAAAAATEGDGDGEWFVNVQRILSSFRNALRQLPIRQLFVSSRLHRLLSESLKPALQIQDFRRASAKVEGDLCERLAAHIGEARREKVHIDEATVDHISANAFNDAKTILELVELNRLAAHTGKSLRNVLVTRDRVLLDVQVFLRANGVADGNVVREIAQYLPTLNFRSYGAKVQADYFERLVAAIAFAHASVDSLDERSNFWVWARDQRLYTASRFAEFNKTIDDVYTSWNKLSQVAMAAAAPGFLGSFFEDAGQDINEALALLNERSFRSSVERSAERAVDTISRNNLRFVSGILWLDVSQTLRSEAAVEHDPLLAVYFDFTGILKASTIRTLVDGEDPLPRVGAVTERLVNKYVSPDEALLSACLAAWASNWQLSEYLAQAGERMTQNELNDSMKSVLLEELHYVRLVAARKQVSDRVSFERAQALHDHRPLHVLPPHKRWRKASEFAALQLRYAWTLAGNGESEALKTLLPRARAELKRALEATADKRPARGSAEEEAERVVSFQIKNNQLSLALLTALNAPSVEASQTLLAARDGVNVMAETALPAALVRVVSFNRAAASVLCSLVDRTDAAVAWQSLQHEHEIMAAWPSDAFIRKTAAYVMQKLRSLETNA